MTHDSANNQLNLALKKNAPLSFNHPLVSSILQDEAMCNLEPRSATEPPNSSAKKRVPARSPTMGGIRRIMRRAHTPEGLVLHYESRLRSFLGFDTSDSTEALLSDDEEWQVIDMEEGMFSPFARDVIFDEGDMVILSKALLQAQQSSSHRSSSIAAGVESSLVTEWPIQDSFTRLIVHTMCRYYGLVSFSDTLDSGKCVLHICHPHFFSNSQEVGVPKVTFYQYLYNDSN
ncbi:hypothetical protein IWW36_003833 [Coemansia brasiliensis]|uniref:R3H domain-containing protein n=1 Tax=Coemansia brasiliensis TaxID=2650707 RepID=A0A9W8I729_9FUNG|nr:hypothetical protein IWW36_003833 [Coemansia brasiliensis]